MTFLKFKPTHIQFIKHTHPYAPKYSISLISRDSSPYDYLREYSYLNLQSSYKTWHELSPPQQNRFIDRYIAIHDQGNNLKQSVLKMDKENKDVNYLFSYLYNGLKEKADEMENHRLEEEDGVSDVIIRRDEDVEALLFKK